MDEAKITADLQKATMKDQLERIKIEADAKAKDDRIDLDISKIESDERMKGAELGKQMAEDIFDKSSE